ncbi:MAG: ABC transporter substrate-binding protein [Clostridiales bacterium]|nr:ABC transporter substrate-binding protein [Clostridiales bacterium]
MNGSAVKRWTGLVLLAAALFSLTACGGQAEEEASPSPTVTPDAVPMSFTLSCTDAALHPILSTDRTNLTLAALLWEGLFALDPAFRPQGLLCQRYETSEDGLTWTFVLRPGVTFSDGSPLTAEEVCASLNLARGAGSRFAARLAGIRSVTAEGDRAVTVALSAPNGNLPALLDIPIVKGEGDTPLGTGPYVLQTGGETPCLVRRAGWWRHDSVTPPLDTIPLRPVSSADALIQSFDTGQTSLVTVDFTGANPLGYAGGYARWDFPSTTMLFLGFNCQKGPCRSTPVRQAISRALDRTALAAALYAGYATAAALPVSPASPLYDASLAASLGPDTQAPAGLGEHSLTLLVNSENPYKTAAADFLAEELGRLGLLVTVRSAGWSDYEAALKAGDFDLYLGEVMLTADFDLTNLLGRTGALNYGGHSDGETEPLLAAFRQAGDAERPAAAAALYTHLAEAAPFAPLCFKNGSVLTRWGLVSGLTPTQQDAFYGFAWSVADGTA